MSTISNLFNSKQFVSFYNENETSKVNLVKLAIKEDRDEFRVNYETGLENLKKLIIDIDKDKNSSVANEIKSIIGKKILDQPDYSDVLLSIFKALNPHIPKMFTPKEIGYLSSNNQSIQRLADATIRVCFTDCDDQDNVELFFDYCTSFNHLKSLKMIYTAKTSFDDQSNSRLTNLNNHINSYSLRNSFFDDQIGYFPTFNSNNIKYLFKDLKSMDIVPKDMVKIIYNWPYEDLPIKIVNEAELENLMLLNLDWSRRLFSKAGIEFLEQRRMHMENNDKIHTSIPDIIVKYKNHEVPLELKFQDLKKIFNEFKSRRNDNSQASKLLIEYFSQCFLQLLTTKSRLSLLSDGTFVIAFLLEVEPPVIADITEELRPIRCSLTIFDSKEDKFDVSLFILLFIIQNEEKLTFGEDEYKNYCDAITVSNDEKIARTVHHYQILEKFFACFLEVRNSHRQQEPVRPGSSDMLSVITEESSDSTHIAKKAKFDALDKNIEDSENAADKFVGTILDYRLKVLFNSMDWFPFVILDATRLANCQIISGGVLYESYSTVLLHMGLVYKVIDPVRLKVDRIVDYPSFYHRIKAMMQLFERID
ncbi:hypothetical protein DFJ63DRAFT_310143 [Scheffersomyces coipomensis]|uniref:uncharacterized protein n=1 Tax=Scheffersomyces coipomensis TaxID=1788519 RepID=UPI00315C64ED